MLRKKLNIWSYYYYCCSSRAQVHTYISTRFIRSVCCAKEESADFDILNNNLFLRLWIVFAGESADDKKHSFFRHFQQNLNDFADYIVLWPEDILKLSNLSNYYRNTHWTILSFYIFRFFASSYNNETLRTSYCFM